MPTPVSPDVAQGALLAGSAGPLHADRVSPPMSRLTVRTFLENSEAFFRHLLIPIGREQEEEVIGMFETAGLAGDKPARRGFFFRNPGLRRRVEMRTRAVASIHVSRRFVLAQKRPGL